jgi:hypothetical protein
VKVTGFAVAAGVPSFPMEMKGLDQIAVVNRLRNPIRATTARLRTSGRLAIVNSAIIVKVSILEVVREIRQFFDLVNLSADCW